MAEASKDFGPGAWFDCLGFWFDFVTLKLHREKTVEDIFVDRRSRCEAGMIG
jgi:hypothetical protein